jgi:N-acetylmuramoyl-L-alanine amidase
LINFIKFILLFFIYFNQSFSDELVNLRYGANDDKKRIVLDLKKDLIFDSRVFSKKIEITFKKRIKIKDKFKYQNNLKKIFFDDSNNTLNLVFDRSIYKPNIYLLKKKKNEFSRIVIDYSLRKIKKKTIVIDPGHGAVGIHKNLEKNITLKVGLLLKKKFMKKTNFEVILTRVDDRYLKLKDRTKIAKKNNADIFISLHADYNKNPRTRGLSFYTLSEKASDKEAEALARRENKSDLIDGVDLSNESSEVTNILLDLTKRETLNQSSSLVNYLISSFEGKINLLHRTHRYAGFVVLKSLDIPSVLIEMGYLSNKNDSKLLLTNDYQNKIADKISDAVIEYFVWKEKNIN